MNRLFSVVLALAFFLSQGQVAAARPATENEKKPLIIIGDTQRTSLLEFWRERNNGVSKHMLDEVCNENPAAVIHLGDMVFNGSSRSSWNDFEHDAASVFSRQIPFYPVLGNHEYFLGHSVPEYVKTHFPPLAKKTWYSVTFGKLAVILLNSNFSALSAAEINEQNSWYAAELQKFQNDTSFTWIIVGCHHAPFTNSTVITDNKRVQKEFVLPFIAVSKAKIFFTGHCHGYEHFVNYGKDFIVTAGGGGPRPKLKKNNRDSFHQDICKADSPRDFNYCRLTFVDQHLLFEMIAWDGKSEKTRVGEHFVIN